jgi:hypothetical protein
MINFYDHVPSVYVNTSRDFQYLSWLINVVLNSVKHNIDDLYDLPNNKADPRLTELLALTLGFKVKRNYDKNQLTALVSVLPSILKHKGTKKALLMAGDALLNASGAFGVFDCNYDNNTLEVVIPKELVDTTLFIDLLPYILPAGVSCRIVRKTQIKDTKYTNLYYSDVPTAQWYQDLEMSDNGDQIVGLATLFDVDKYNPDDPNSQKIHYANFNRKDNLAAGDYSELNTGLLGNTVVPVIPDQINAAHRDQYEQSSLTQENITDNITDNEE